MIIQKPRLCFVYNKVFVDFWGQYIVGGLETSGQADYEHVDRLFKVRLKSWLSKRIKSTIICVQNWKYVGNTKEKLALLIWNWYKIKQILTSRKCDLSCLTILTLFVCWDTMGNESDSLPSYNELRNCSYYIMLNYIDSPSTPQIYLTRTDTTISSSRSYQASAPCCTEFIN